MAKLSRRPGTKVMYNGQEMKVVTSKDFHHDIISSADGEMFVVPVIELAQAAESTKPSKPKIDPRRSQKVKPWVAAMKPLLVEGRHRTEEAVKAAMEKLGVSRATVYRAIERWEVEGTTDALPPPTRPGGRGKSRLPQEVQDLLTTVVQNLVKRNAFTRRAFYKAAKKALAEKGFSVAQATLKRRAMLVPGSKWASSIRNAKAEKRKRDPSVGENPEVHHPLEFVQIDHWKADVELVSDDRLGPIGRVWITVAIDVYSRMICGIHVGIDAPSFTTVGLAMISVMTSKDIINRTYGLEIDCPIAGKVDNLGFDNAGEFVGASMRKSCEHFNMGFAMRPIDQPQYGAYIERLNGTLATEFKDIPGATGSNIKERMQLDPDRTAAFTLEDITKHVWLIVDQYHHRVHGSLGVTPLERFKSYYFGPEGQKRRLPDVYTDDLALRRQWYPLEVRTMRSTGIRIDYLDYYSESIRKHVQWRAGQGKWQVRRNPLDVREIYIRHETKQPEWITVPVRYPDVPEASLYQLREAKREARRQVAKPQPADVIRILKEREKHAAAAVKATKTARREDARARHHERLRKADAEARARADNPAPRPDAPTTGSQHSPVHVAGLPPPGRDATGLKVNERNFADILASISDDDIDAEFE